MLPTNNNGNCNNNNNNNNSIEAFRALIDDNVGSRTQRMMPSPPLMVGRSAIVRILPLITAAEHGGANHHQQQQHQHHQSRSAIRSELITELDQHLRALEMMKCSSYFFVDVDNNSTNIDHSSGGSPYSPYYNNIGHYQQQQWQQNPRHYWCDYDQPMFASSSSAGKPRSSQPAPPPFASRHPPAANSSQQQQSHHYHQQQHHPSAGRQHLLHHQHRHHQQQQQQSPTRLRPGKFPVHQDDVPSTNGSTTVVLASDNNIDNGCFATSIACYHPSETFAARQKRRSRSQPSQPRAARESAVSASSTTASSSAAAPQELNDFIEEDFELNQCQSEGNATIWAANAATNSKKITTKTNNEVVKTKNVGAGECIRGGKGGSCCSQDSGIRSSTHSAGSLTGSSDTDAGDGHSGVPCCSNAICGNGTEENGGGGGVLFMAEAVFENVAMLRDELPFSPGDEVAVLDCPSLDLWYGICGPRSGWFPAAYIRPKNRELCHQLRQQMLSAKSDATADAVVVVDDANGAAVDAVGYRSTEMRVLRKRIVQELMSTEREYVRLLDDLVQGFLSQCRRRRELFPEERCQRIFGNLEMIHTLHAHLYRELQSAFDANEPERSALANVFLKNSQQFGIYTDYCNNRALSCAELAQLEQQPQYFHFFEACRLLRGMSKLPLDAFLLTPVQRICRYPLQLLELLKATPAGHPDRLALELAQRTMKQVAAQVNDGKRRVDAIQKIWLWQKSVHGFRGPDLIENNHRLLINADLHCRALWRGQPQWAKAVHVYLFDQTIVLCRRDVLRRSQLVFKERMSLQGTAIRDLHDGKESITGSTLRNAFKLSGPAREYIFSCADPATKGLWLEAVRERPRPQPPTSAERRLAMLI